MLVNLVTFLYASYICSRGSSKYTWCPKLSLFYYIFLSLELKPSNAQAWIKAGYRFSGSEFPISDINSALFTHLICAFAGVNSSSYELSVWALCIVHRWAILLQLHEHCKTKESISQHPSFHCWWKGKLYHPFINGQQSFVQKIIHWLFNKDSQALWLPRSRPLLGFGKHKLRHDQYGITFSRVESRCKFWSTTKL